MSELLPCPFCGSADVDHKFSYFKLPAEEGGGTYGHEPGCNACGASAPAEIWNRRSALSQEAVRNEALDVLRELFTAYQRYENIRLVSIGPLVEGARERLVEAQGAAAHLLKREPNAAAQAGQCSDSAPSHEGHAAGPAPPAPDVASMVKRLLEREHDTTCELHQKSGYTVIRSCDCTLSVRKEAAALLAKLGQGWVPVNERLPTRAKETGTWSDPVLCLFDSGAMSIELCIRYSSGEISWNLAPGVTAKITHWMPLPLTARSLP